VEIRDFLPSDAPALGTAVAALPLLQRYGRSAEDLARDWARARERGESLLVCEDAGVALGVAWFTRAGTLARGGYLRLLAVAAPAQDRGIGRALLAAYEAAVAAMSRDTFLLVSDFNVTAQRFYERHGYHRVGTLPGLVLPDVDELLYWKRLR